MITPGSSHSRRRWLAAGLAIGVVGLLIRLWLFQQPINSDDVLYFWEASSATSLSELGNTSSANGMRLAFMAPPAAYSQIFDTPLFAFYATIYTYALLSFVGLFGFAWVVSGPRAAALAAVLWATSYVSIGVDTRLTPDNLGTALGLIGLALVGRVALPRPGGRQDEPALSRRRVILFAGIGGFTLWLAFCTRESFFIFGGIGTGFGLLSRRRWLVTASVLVGLLVGFVVEYIFMTLVFDDGLLRWKMALDYRENVAEAGTGPGAGPGSSGFAGYKLSDLFVRYPMMLAKLSRGDLLIHMLGLAGFVAWAARWRDRQRVAKLGAGVIAYGFLAFAIVSFDPIVPLMREKLRYYATAAPFFWISAAELIELALFARVGRPRLARWLDRPHRTIAVAVLAVLTALWILRRASDSKEFARNGNDAHWAASARMRSDVVTHQRSTRLYTDFRTSRVMYVLMPRSWDGGALVSVDDGSRTEPGYMLLDWKRLNANTKSGFDAGNSTHRFYGGIERDYLVLRHQRGNSNLDVFYRADHAVGRRVVELEDDYPGGWSGLCAGDDQDAFGLADSEPPACATKGNDVSRYSGGDRPWRRRAGALLAGDQFVEILISARAATSTTLRGYLHWWPPHENKPVRQLMGLVQVGPEEQSYAMWTYLPQPASSYRVVLRGPASIAIDEVRTRLLSRDPLDDVRPVGSPWPAHPIHSRRLAKIARVIADDARTHGRPKVIYADRQSLAAGVSLLTETDGWRWRPYDDGVDPVAMPEAGYVIADPGGVGARAVSFPSAIERGAVVLRSNDRGDLIDVYFAERAPIDRARTELVTGFPDDWTRLYEDTRTVEDLAPGTEVAFVGKDSTDEFIYSDPDLVWRAPATEPLAAGSFIEVTGEARSDGDDVLRALLYWWPADGSKHRQQVLGAVAVGESEQAFKLWTYLPEAASSYRIVLRGEAGVTVSDLHVFSLDRHPDELVIGLGQPW